MKFRSALCGALAFIGCSVVGLGCIVPYTRVCDVPVLSCPPNFTPSLLHDAYNEVSWLVAEPALAVVFSLAALLVMLLAGGGLEARALATGMLAISGALTFAFFMSLGALSGPFFGPGGWLVGATGGVLIAIAGVAAATGVLREARRRAT